jgi:ketosteroid isomerase-like protein
MLKPLVRSAVIAVLLLTSSQASHASDASIAKTLTQLELEWSKATVEHTPAVVERILADDFVGTDGRGILSTKADEIAEATAPDPNKPPLTRVIEETITDMRVRVFGNFGIVNGRTIQTTGRAGTQSEVQFRRTTVWVKRGSRWLCVSFHGSRILNPPAPAAK